MHATTAPARRKELDTLKMRVEMIAWRIEEIGMNPTIRKALPEETLNVFEALLFAQQVPEPEQLDRFSSAVQQVEEELAKDLSFWRSGNETLH